MTIKEGRIIIFTRGTPDYLPRMCAKVIKTFNREQERSAWFDACLHEQYDADFYRWLVEKEFIEYFSGRLLQWPIVEWELIPPRNKECPHDSKSIQKITELLGEKSYMLCWKCGAQWVELDEDNKIYIPF